MKGIFAIAILAALIIPASAHAALIDQVNQAYREVYGKNPTVSQWQYWAGRVQRKEKTTYAALVGAMGFQKAQGSAPAASTAVTTHTAASSGFKISRNLYANPHNPNFLPQGSLIKSPSSPNVYYVRDGKKSWVIPGVLNKWLGENHYFKHNIIHTISEPDLARYPQASSVNKLYIGKVLKHPNGTKFYIDDKFRKRQISDSVIAAYKMPAGNIYPTSAAHLGEFKTGPAATRANLYLGGMVVYTGPYHGGRFWKIEEATGGKLVKRLYLTDYLFEADGYPDESHRAPADAARLARHQRGPDIGRYADGWPVGLGNNIYIVEGEKLRLVTSPEVFAAMGYNPAHVIKVFPELLKKYPKGNSISAFKGVVANGAAINRGGPAAAPSTATHLTRVRPGIRSLISQLNTIYLSVFDKDVTTSENQFWVDYLYNGEVNSKSSLIAAMKIAKATGKKPSRTNRNATISQSTLKNHWFPYLFYFTHQKDPSEDDREYWHRRIETDRNTINKLGGAIQWTKDTLGTTRR